MDLVRSHDIRELVEARVEPCVSIMQPAHTKGPDTTKQDPILLKNLLADAERALREMGRRDATAILDPAAALLHDRDFWQHQAGGLAAFLAPAFARIFRVPLALEPLVLVADRFHVKPLVPLVTGDGRFAVLALSKREIRLFEGTRHTVAGIQLRDQPAGVADLLKEPERQIQFHTGAGGARGPRAAVFHGHGSGDADAKERIRQYFHRIDDVVRDVLRDERVPLVLAGVEYLLPIYREATKYPNLVPGGVAGSVEKMSASELHDRAWPLVEPSFRAGRERAIARLGSRVGAGKTSTRIEDVLRAARDGQVDVLFVANGVQVWGRFDPSSGAVERRDAPFPGDSDLTDLATVWTLRSGGTVYVVDPAERPTGDTIAALHRY